MNRQIKARDLDAIYQVDLYAQANASCVRGRIHSDFVRDRIRSGFGGQRDFVVGALPSWHAKTASSAIVGRLPAPATSFQHTAIVTSPSTAAPTRSACPSTNRPRTRSSTRRPRRHTSDCTKRLYEAAARLGL